MDGLFLAIFPAIVMIIMVLTTRKTILSLSVGLTVGIIFAVLKDNDYGISDVISQLTSYLFIYEDGNLIILPDTLMRFIFILGMITAVITASGGTKAFALWASSKVKGSKTAQLVPFISGLAIFIDDYFNALVVGEISKPITDTQSVSRAKLAYIVDSTAAPITILIPISTWAVAIIGSIAESSGTMSAQSILIGSIPYMFYSILAIAFVALTIAFSINIGKMRDYERDAINGIDSSEEVNDKDELNVTSDSNGKMHIMVISLITLVSSVFGFMLLDAITALNNDLSPISILSLTFLNDYFLNADVAAALLNSAVVTFIVTIVLARINGQSFNDIGAASFTGGKGIVHTLIILFLAFNTSTVFGLLGLDLIVENFVETTTIPHWLFPTMLFIVSGGLAFATGSSWSTFGILIPLIVPFFFTNIPETIAYMSIAAVLSGAVWGDHCSPISDTTVLSASGTNCNLEAHFESQLPYALIVGGISIMTFFVSGALESLLVGYIFATIAVAGTVIAYKIIDKKITV